ncbi:MAG: molybdenum cofactor guanylyltransferase [Flavobacteriales bacterium]|nr:molybdenum cofactor guanylyltransferase [Flavobacteriales bacterium]
MTQEQELTAYVLAGGKSSRMGQDKGLLFLNGTPMVKYVLNALKNHAQSIVILANNDSYNHFGHPVFKDEVKNSGPLSGLCKGLSISKTDWNIFLSCDNPHIHSDFISFLISKKEGYQAVVPYYKNKSYPLTAVYHTSCFEVFNNQLKNKKLKVKEALSLIKVKLIDVHNDYPLFNEKLLTNINTPEDFEKHKNYC